MACSVLMNAALGCFLGAAIGDAAGATLEFKPKSSITPQVVRHAMTMPGGGVWKVSPGQITDDTELAFALAAGLSTSTSPEFPRDAVAAQYSAWLKSSPFDVGITCSKAFKGKKGAEEMASNAVKYSMHSESNGALMRIAPLVLWASNYTLSPEELAALAHADAQLSHPAKACQDASAAYLIAAVHLLKNCGDAAGAVAAAETWALKYACPSVVHWLTVESKQSEDEFNVDESIGWVRHAFKLTFSHLRKSSTYEDAIYSVLLQGGDTDTNAAIVGCMIGALHGAASIPSYMKEPVLTSRPSDRPSMYWAASVPSVVESLLKDDNGLNNNCIV